MSESEVVQTVSPTPKNLPALIAYPLGLLSLIPAIGLFMGPCAVVFGILGLRRFRISPIDGGNTHSWIGISLGCLSMVVHAGFIGLVAWWFFQGR
jgi:hypothetical protein